MLQAWIKFPMKDYYKTPIKLWNLNARNMKIFQKSTRNYQGVIIQFNQSGYKALIIQLFK